MSVVSAAHAGRRAAERTMLDTFTAYAHVETTDADGMTVETWAPQGTTPGKFPSKRTGGDATSTRTVDVGGVERAVIEGGLHLPWSAAPQVGQRYKCTALGPYTHPSILGRTVEVVETHPASAMTAWRLDVVVVEEAP